MLAATIQETQALERRFRMLLKEPGMFSSDFQVVRRDLRTKYHALLLTTLDLAVIHGIEANLWKLLHYKIIDEFRSKLKAAIKTAAVSAKNSQTTMHHEYRTLTSSFRAFLEDSSTFYIQMIQSLVHCYDIVELKAKILGQLDFAIAEVHEPYQIIEISHEQREKVVQIIHRSLIYLGDLSRYAEVQSEKKIKHWGAAKMFYGLAMVIVPNNGNPFNQLAVVNTYEGNNVEATELYLRRCRIK